MAVMIEDKAKPLRQCTDNVPNKDLSGKKGRALSRTGCSWDLDL